jgi:hypothetical protein
MEIEALKGLVIFTGIVAMYTFALLGCLERRLKKVSAVIEDAKYVN